MKSDLKIKKLTHGEAFFERKKAFEQSNASALNMRSFDTIPPRMSREKALQYYGKKLREVFGTQDQEPDDFISAEHRFDYYEAQRILERMGISA